MAFTFSSHQQNDGGNASTTPPPPPLQVVVAPCDMEAGFTFMARTDSGDDIPVTVPSGGVREGQTFRSASPSSTIVVTGSFTNLREISPLLQKKGSSVPAAATWKDGLFGCCRYGPFHPSLWNAICCPQLLAAQVMTRLHLNWRAQSVSNDNDDSWRSTFRIVLVIVCAVWAVSFLTAPPVENAAEYKQSFWCTTIYNMVTLSYGLYTLIILTRLRRRVRQQHGIAAYSSATSSSSKYYNNYACDKRYEDCCVSFWCGCCSVAQMARQTADYEQDQAACCSSTGLMLQEEEDNDDAASGQSYQKGTAVAMVV